MAQNSQFFSASVSHYEFNLGCLIEMKYHEHLLRKNNELDKLKKTYERYLDFVLKPVSKRESISHREEWTNIMRELELFKVC